jgi:ElaB/YqjD/DUF883 family membrane-anchored ribosome-binding protein
MPRTYAGLPAASVRRRTDLAARRAHAPLPISLPPEAAMKTTLALDPSPNGHPADTAMAASANGVLTAVSREFQNVVADIEDLVKATTSLTGDDLARAKARLGERIAVAKKYAADTGSAIAVRARDAAGKTDAYVHEQPWKVIGASAAVAFLLGVLVARRN